MGNSSATGDAINETLHGFIYRVAVINETVEGSNNRDDVINNNIQDINNRLNVMNEYAKILTICAHRINFSLHESFDGVTAMPISSEFLILQAITFRILKLYREHNCFPRSLNSSITRFESLLNNAVIRDFPKTLSAINHSM